MEEGWKRINGNRLMVFYRGGQIRGAIRRSVGVAACTAVIAGGEPQQFSNESKARDWVVSSGVKPMASIAALGF